MQLNVGRLPFFYNLVVGHDGKTMDTDNHVQNIQYLHQSYFLKLYMYKDKIYKETAIKKLDYYKETLNASRIEVLKTIWFHYNMHFP